MRCEWNDCGVRYVADTKRVGPGASLLRPSLLRECVAIGVFPTTSHAASSFGSSSLSRLPQGYVQRQLPIFWRILTKMISVDSLRATLSDLCSRGRGRRGSQVIAMLHTTSALHQFVSLLVAVIAGYTLMQMTADVNQRCHSRTSPGDFRATNRSGLSCRPCRTSAVYLPGYATSGASTSAVAFVSRSLTRVLHVRIGANRDDLSTPPFLLIILGKTAVLSLTRYPNPVLFPILTHIL